MVITTFMAYFVTTFDESSHPIITRCYGSMANAEHRTYTLYTYPSKFLCSFWRVAHLQEHGHRYKGSLNSWWQFLCFGGYGVCFWCDTPLLRTGIFALDLCGNSRSGDAKPHSTALGVMGSMPIMSWLRFCPVGNPYLLMRHLRLGAGDLM